ncbi:hypothetical protein QFC21_001947 [Naganishia friedmannii]|uniref:Uncharacterized protein n=1 Tax=Naganishia friedmannii TaxID=89922 RepID=A0ACC2VYQ1_9TREE|nr:hypothetical protein QFC21_001947 [Naganishia friedmannii]
MLPLLYPPLTLEKNLEGNPKEIIIVTEERMKGPLEELARSVDPTKIRVLTVPFANKRLQMAHGIRNTSTDIIVFADDDAIWPATLLPYVLACFEDQKIGGVGTSQRVQPCGDKMTMWEVLAAMRLTIRNIEIASSAHIDGGIPCLSGRTAAYRTIILKDPEFLHGFTNDLWLGNPKYHLNSGDDKFLTRWMVSHGWNTYVQVCKEAELLSTMKPNWRFLKQVLRWTRNTWRSDFRSIFMERHIWHRHPYVAYTMIDKFINPLTLLVGPCLVMYLLVKSTRNEANGGYHLPACAVMKIYALFTLHETGWGTRAGIGDPATALAAAEKEKANRPVSPYMDRPDTPVLRPYQRPVTGLTHQTSSFGDEYPDARQDMEMAYHARKMA